MTDRTAVLTVDLNRGHLDPDVATLPLDPDRARTVIAETDRLASAARGAGVPVIHVSTMYRSAEEIAANPNVELTNDGARERIGNHNLEGSPGVEVVPELVEDEDVVVYPKKRYSPFLYGDLDFVLRTRDVERLLVTGVNTNTCVQCTCFEAYNRDYEVTVVEECVDSMYGPELHEWALKNIDRALGSVVSLEEVLDELGEKREQRSRA